MKDSVFLSQQHDIIGSNLVGFDGSGFLNYMTCTTYHFALVCYNQVFFAVYIFQVKYIVVIFIKEIAAFTHASHYHALQLNLMPYMQ